MKLEKIINEQYKDVESVVVETLKKKNNEQVETLLEMYTQWLNITSLGDRMLKKFYEKAHELINEKSSSHSQEDITTFSILLDSFEKENNFAYSGIFLSALINNHYDRTKTEEEYKLILSHIHTPLHRIGMKTNGAHIFVEGNCGEEVANGMSSGTITLDGNCELGAGYFMKGGTIQVKNAGAFFGEDMTGGTLICDDVEELSQQIRGGEIYVLKGTLNVEEMYFTEDQKKNITFYYNGKKIFPEDTSMNP